MATRSDTARANGPSSPVHWAVLLFCAWQAGDLITDWRHSPFDAFGWLAFGVWLTPTAAFSIDSLRRGQPGSGNPALCWAALAATCAGILADMHLPRHIALALAIGAITPRFRLFPVWLVLGLAWIPALGWALRGWPPAMVIVARCLLAAAGAFAAYTGWKRERVQP